MYTLAQHLDALPVLYEQHRQYTEKLGNTHALLSKLYKKLAKVERKLSDEEKPSRTQAKKLWWSRTVAKQSIEKLEAEKLQLYSLLQQCRNLINSYNHMAYTSPGTSFWNTYFPPTPFVATPFTSSPETPWTAGSYRGSTVGQQQPHYWDLSMLGERRDTPSADSGYHEADVTVQAPEHVFAHEIMSVDSGSAVGAASTTGSEKDDVPEIVKLAAIDTNRANALHRRRNSENAVAWSGERPKLVMMQHRGVSVTPRYGRTITAPEIGILSGDCLKNQVDTNQ